MPIKMHAIQIKVPTPYFNSIINFGRDHGLTVACSDRVMPSSVVSHIVKSVINHHKNPDMIKIRGQEGGTTLDHIARAVHKHLSAVS